MLNENLAKIRKEKGLTQESLAIKLNVVRQTVSKWENGTAVPDADTLCRIAEALEVEVSDLLGRPREGDPAGNDALARTLAEINEQLAIRNRRSQRIWRLIAGVLLTLLLGFVVLVLLLILLYVSTGMSKSEVTVSVSETVVEEESRPSISVDGVIYYSTGRVMAEEPDPGTVEFMEMRVSGEEKEVTEMWAKITDATISREPFLAVLIEDEWYIFMAD